MSLGNIYYGQDDHIATDQNMWNSESLEKRNNIEKKISHNDVRMTQTVLDRMNHFDIDASLKLSFLGGLGMTRCLFIFNLFLLVSTSGSAHYLDDRRDKRETGRQRKATKSDFQTHFSTHLSFSFCVIYI